MRNDDWVNWSHNTIMVPKPVAFQAVCHKDNFAPLDMKVEYDTYKKMQFIAKKVDALEDEETLLKGFFLHTGIQALAVKLIRSEGTHDAFLVFIHEKDIEKAEQIGKPCNQ